MMTRLESDQDPPQAARHVYAARPPRASSAAQRDTAPTINVEGRLSEPHITRHAVASQVYFGMVCS